MLALRPWGAGGGGLCPPNRPFLPQPRGFVLALNCVFFVFCFAPFCFLLKKKEDIFVLILVVLLLLMLF